MGILSGSQAFKKLRVRARRKFWKKYKGPMECSYCNNPVSRFMLDGDELLATIDHVIPLASGGTSEYNNLVLACFKCNQGRK